MHDAKYYQEHVCMDCDKTTPGRNYTREHYKYYPTKKNVIDLDESREKIEIQWREDIKKGQRERKERKERITLDDAQAIVSSSAGPSRSKFASSSTASRPASPARNFVPNSTRTAHQSQHGYSAGTSSSNRLGSVFASVGKKTGSRQK